MRSVLKQKKGQVFGIGQSVVFGAVGLIIGIIVAFVLVSVLTNSSLLTSGSAEDNATDRLVGNFTSGVDNISSKVPTIFTVAVIAIILIVLGVVVAVYQKFKLGGGTI